MEQVHSGIYELGQLDPKEQTSMKFQLQNKHFLIKKSVFENVVCQTWAVSSNLDLNWVSRWHIEIGQDGEEMINH